MLVGFFGTVRHGSDLGHADASHHAGGADGTGANANLHAVNAGGDEVVGGAGGGHIAGKKLDVGVTVADGLHLLEHADRVAVGGVDGDHVHLGVHQRIDTVEHVAGHTHRRAAQQATVGILGGIGILGGLFNILDGDQTAQHAIVIHNGQLFNAVLGQDHLGLLQGGAHGGGDQVLAGHELMDGAVIIRDKAQVAVGQDTHQLATFADRHAGDLVAAHEVFRILNQVIGRKEEGIGDHAMLGALDLVHLRSLIRNGHILVDDAQAAFAGHGDSHPRIGDGIHRSGHQRDVQLDDGRQLDGQIHILGQDFAAGRHQQHIVKSKTFTHDLLKHGNDPPSQILNMLWIISNFNKTPAHCQWPG